MRKALRADWLRSACVVLPWAPAWGTATRAVIGTLRPTERRRANLPKRKPCRMKRPNGAEGSRTPDLCSAIAALSQLSYSPSYTGSAPNVSIVSKPVAPGRLTKQPRSWRGRADIVSYDASGGCQAPASVAPCPAAGWTNFAPAGNTRANQARGFFRCCVDTQ
jgi:hypothetical protein